ncbi:hypothetical protein G5C66_04260 [Nocardioides sp. KC13]|uniref:Helix-turn-helix domain-containing protein n=1 Tax=Nocardioides turkmenicus TaxID=2711220 RepID=A0A6M1R2I0_9ACTN|nr:hypothetical protein [Nocardioides sp. KC13]NGN91949.1 hypothetical protein [Nocardioides sp. KC13]
MLITTQQACERLAKVHLLGRNQALRILQSGLAGPRSRVGSAYRYDSNAVEQLLARPRSTDEALDRHQPFIARIGRTRPFDLSATWEEQRADVSTGWYLPSLAYHQMRPRLPVPFLATLGAWVVFGAEITGYENSHEAADQPPDQPSGQPRSNRAQNRRLPPASLVLGPPGDWFSEFEDTWLPIENGATWTLWGALNSTPSRADPLSMYYYDQLEEERFLKHLYSTGRHRALARRLEGLVVDDARER